MYTKTRFNQKQIASDYMKIGPVVSFYRIPREISSTVFHLTQAKSFYNGTIDSNANGIVWTLISKSYRLEPNH